MLSSNPGLGKRREFELFKSQNQTEQAPKLVPTGVIENLYNAYSGLHYLLEKLLKRQRRIPPVWLLAL